MKKVLVFAYLAKNLGDDLFIKILVERYPRVEFRILTTITNYSIINKYKNTTEVILPRTNRIQWAISNYLRSSLAFNIHFKKLRRLIKKEAILCDAFLVIGGSLFMEVGNTYYKKKFYSIIYSEFSLKPKLILGSNFGPYRSDIFKTFFKNIFKKSTDVCFREKYSYDLFKDIATVRYSPDIVFQLDEGVQNKIKQSVGFSLIDLDSRNNFKAFSDMYQDLHVSLIERYLNDGYEVRLFAFCIDEGDEKSINKILFKLNPLIKNKVKIILYKGEIDAFLEEFKKVEYIYCSRFHAMILGLIYGQNIYPLIYSKKMTNVLSDIGYQGSFSIIEDIQSLNVNDIRKAILMNNCDITSFKKESESQFYFLDRVLLNK
jgi:colanic acid/amylovoran biosynthesis protein